MAGHRAFLCLALLLAAAAVSAKKSGLKITILVRASAGRAGLGGGYRPGCTRIGCGPHMAQGAHPATPRPPVRPQRKAESCGAQAEPGDDVSVHYRVL